MGFGPTGRDSSGAFSGFIFLVAVVLVIMFVAWLFQAVFGVMINE